MPLPPTDAQPSPRLDIRAKSARYTYWSADKPRTTTAKNVPHIAWDIAQTITRTVFPAYTDAIEPSDHDDRTLLAGEHPLVKHLVQRFREQDAKLSLGECTSQAKRAILRVVYHWITEHPVIFKRQPQIECPDKLQWHQITSLLDPIHEIWRSTRDGVKDMDRSGELLMTETESICSSATQEESTAGKLSEWCESVEL